MCDARFGAGSSTQLRRAGKPLTLGGRIDSPIPSAAISIAQDMRTSAEIVANQMFSHRRYPWIKNSIPCLPVGDNTL